MRGFTPPEQLVATATIGLLAGFAARRSFGQVGKSEARLAHAQGR